MDEQGDIESAIDEIADQLFERGYAIVTSSGVTMTIDIRGDNSGQEEEAEEV